MNYAMVYVFDDAEQAAAFWSGLTPEQRGPVRSTRLFRVDELQIVQPGRGWVVPGAPG